MAGARSGGFEMASGSRDSVDLAKRLQGKGTRMAILARLMELSAFCPP